MVENPMYLMLSSGRSDWPAAAAGRCEQNMTSKLSRLSRSMAIRSERCSTVLTDVTAQRLVQLMPAHRASTSSQYMNRGFTAHLRWCSRNRLRNSWTTVPSIVGTADRSRTTTCSPPPFSSCKGPSSKRLNVEGSTRSSAVSLCCDSLKLKDIII